MSLNFVFPVSQTFSFIATFCPVVLLYVVTVCPLYLADEDSPGLDINETTELIGWLSFAYSEKKGPYLTIYYR